MSFDSLNVKQLKQLCKANNLPGFSTMKKGDLVEYLNKAGVVQQPDGKRPEEPTVTVQEHVQRLEHEREAFPGSAGKQGSGLPVTEPLVNNGHENVVFPGSARQRSLKEMRQEAKDRGLKGFSKFNKTELAQFLLNPTEQERKPNVWQTALKEYNSGRKQYVIPQRGTQEHSEISDLADKLRKEMGLIK